MREYSNFYKIFHLKMKYEDFIAAITELAIFNGTYVQWYDFKNKNEELINKIGTPYLDRKENINDKMKNEGLQNKNYTLIDILNFKSQRTVFIEITIIIAFSSYIYLGIILNLGKMKGNFFLIFDYRKILKI